jgi:hypothetical protein
MKLTMYPGGIVLKEANVCFTVVLLVPIPAPQRLSATTVFVCPLSFPLSNSFFYLFSRYNLAEGRGGWNQLRREQKTCLYAMYVYMYVIQGCLMSETDYDGRSALHLAAAEGHLECVKVHILSHEYSLDHGPSFYKDTKP